MCSPGRNSIESWVHVRAYRVCPTFNCPRAVLAYRLRSHERDEGEESSGASLEFVFGFCIHYSTDPFHPLPHSW
jgi:hypothetical protein